MPSNQLILCHPLLLWPSIFPSVHVFSTELALHIRWPKYWSFSFGISPSNEYSGLISFKIDWFDLFAVQGTLKSLLKHHSLKASILHLPPNYLDNIPWLFIICYQVSLSITSSQSLFKLMSIESMMASISSSVVPFSHLQSFPASGSFLMSQFFGSGSQSIGASVSVLPLNIQDWFPLGLTGLISLQSKGLSRVFSNTTVQKHQFFGAQLSLWSNSHIHTWLLEKPGLFCTLL